MFQAWSAPIPAPGPITYYTALAYTPFTSNYSIIYSGNATSCVVPYTIGTSICIRAATTAGIGPCSDRAYVSLPSATSSSQDYTTQPYFYVPLAVGGLLVLALLLFVYRYIQQWKLSRNPLVFTPPKPDSWEVAPSCVELGRKLGQGNFGTVYAAKARNVQPDLPGWTDVAVKMLNDDASVQDKKEFVAEANLMKKFSKPWHSNVRFYCNCCVYFYVIYCYCACR